MSIVEMIKRYQEKLIVFENADDFIGLWKDVICQAFIRDKTNQNNFERMFKKTNSSSELGNKKRFLFCWPL